MSQTPPPPPSDGYYGAPPPPNPSQGWSVGAAVNYGWTKFQANVGQIILAGIAVLVGVAIFQGLGFVIRNILVQDPECTGSVIDNTFKCTDGSGFFISLLASAVSSFLFFLVYQVISAGIIRGSLGITEGRNFEFSEVFKTDKIGPVIITSLISAAIVFVGTLLCIIPGIIASFMLSYALYFVIDKDMAPVDALKASFNLVKDNLGEAFVWAIVAFLIVIAGFIACLVGAIVAIPVSIIGTAFTYKKLTGQEVAA